MELSFEGGNCITLTTKKAKVVVDDNLESLGLKSVAQKADIAVFTQAMLASKTKTGDAFVIDGPGEYELKEVSVQGIAVRAHMDEEGKKSATIYRIATSSVMIAVVGHIYPDLSEDLLEEIGMIDIAIVPVGGNGYTLDSQGATKVIKKLDPKIVIPTHYNEKGVSYEVPQAELEDFVKEMGGVIEKIDKLKIKSGIIPDALTLYQLTR